jgi:hypothetical protein
MPDYGNVKKYAALFEDAICESKICLRSVVAVAIRCARRVQPRFQIPVREPEFSDELIRAIMVAQRFATKSQPDVRVDFDYSVANGADLYGLWAENVNLLHPANAAFAAHYAARSALHAQISGGDYARRNPPFASTEARSAIHYAAKAAAHSSIAAIVGGDEENATSRTLSDIKVLKELELGEFPEFGDAVDFDRIGPLLGIK